MHSRNLLTALLLTAALQAQTVFTHTASCDVSMTDVVIGDPEPLLVVIGMGSEAGKLITTRDPYLYTSLIPVRVQPEWVYAVETRAEKLGLRPCFRTIADASCEPQRSFALNVVVAAMAMPELGFTTAMPHYAIWRIGYPGAGPNFDTPEMTVAWLKITPW